jgi:hypothetical protein
MLVDEFKSSDFVGEGELPYKVGRFMVVKHWLGIHWLQHSGVLGVGTTSSNLLFHKTAVVVSHPRFLGSKTELLANDRIFFRCGPDSARYCGLAQVSSITPDQVVTQIMSLLPLGDSAL